MKLKMNEPTLIGDKIHGVGDIAECDDKARADYLIKTGLASEASAEDIKAAAPGAPPPKTPPKEPSLSDKMTDKAEKKLL